MKKLPLATLLVALLAPNVCHALEYTLSGTIDALQAGTNGDFGSFDSGVAGAGDGTGTISGTYDDSTNLLSYTLNWQNLTASITNMHFHNGVVGMGGDVDLGIPGPWSSPQIATDVAVADDAELNLLSGEWYVNVHTSNFPGGEIRGQVIVTPVPEPVTSGIIGIGIFAFLCMFRRRR